MYKFHHNKIVNIMCNSLVISALTIIFSGALLILTSVVNGEVPSSFGIYN